MAEALLDGAAQAIIAKCIRQAVAGDSVAMRLCVERILAPRRERPIEFRLPRMKTAADAAKATAALAAAVSKGELLPSEAAELGKLIESFVRALEANEFEQRLAALEERAAGGGS